MQQLANIEEQATNGDNQLAKKEGVETIYSQSNNVIAPKKFVRPMTAANRIKLKQ